MILNELRLLIRHFINESLHHPALRIFDFDDTLTFTGSKIYIRDKDDGSLKKILTSGEYAKFDKAKLGDKYYFDFSDFSKLIEPRKIDWTLNILRKVVEKHGPSGVAILTARGHKEPVEEFLEMEGFPPGIEITALGDSNPLKKAEWVAEKIKDYGLRRVDFFDDSDENVKKVKELESILKINHPELNYCKINALHIKHNKED